MDGKRLSPGIYAIVEVNGSPYQREIMPEQSKSEYCVDLLIKDNLMDNPLYLENLKGDKLIEIHNYLVNGFQRASMPLEKQTYERIFELIRKEKQKNI